MRFRATPAALLLAAVFSASCERHEPAATEENSAPSPGSSVLAKLDSIVIPLIDFEDTAMWEAIDYLRVRSMELDTEEPIEYRGVSILLNHKARDPDDPSLTELASFRRIDRLQAKDITLTEAIIQTCEAAGADAYLTSHGIVICRKGTPPFPNSKGETGEIWKKLTSP